MRTEIYTDDKGHSHTRKRGYQGTLDSYVNDSNGYTVSIDYQTFLKFCQNFVSRLKNIPTNQFFG